MSATAEDSEGTDASVAAPEPQSASDRRSSPALTAAHRIGLVLNQIDHMFFADEWLSSLTTDQTSGDSLESESSDMQKIIEKVMEYQKTRSDKEDVLVPNADQMRAESGADHMSLLMNLVLGSGVTEEQRHQLLEVIADLNDQHSSEAVVESHTIISATESKNDCSDDTLINTNLSEEEVIRNSEDEPIDAIVPKSEPNIDVNSNSMISSSDIKAKESFAQSSNDLEIVLPVVNDNSLQLLIEENQKLMAENEKYIKLLDRINRTEVPISDGSIEDVNALKNRNQDLQSEIMKGKEIHDNLLMEIEVLRHHINHSKSTHSEALDWNREAIASFCNREYLYKLIISQLLNDGHHQVALSLSNTNKNKLVPPSDRLHQLVAIAIRSLSAEGDSSSSGDLNLIDLDGDHDIDRFSGSSRASFYEPGHNFRGHSYSPESEHIPPMSKRMLDMASARIISKTSPAGDPIQSLTHVQSNDSIASRSTPDISIPPFGHSVSNGMPALSPNPVDISGHSSAMGGPIERHGLDLNDYITQLNLAQLMYMNTDPGTTSVASSANTPSPTPITPSVPLENGGLVLNEAALQNISQLVKMSATDNGLIPTTSTSPTSIGSTQGRSQSAAGAKPNVMQIRCKFGQLGQQNGQFSSPHGFCLGVDEEIVIADTNNHRICIFDKSADFKHSFGVPGKDEAQLWYPRKVAIIRNTSGGANSAPRYVICDRGAERSRMQIFTRSGHFVRKIAIRYIDIVAGLAITPNGHIVAVDSVAPTVFVIAESGDLLRWFDCSEYMREPSDIAINNHEYYICDFKGHCVVVFNDEGQYMRKIGCEGLTSFPNGIDISDAGDILVGDSHGNRFHVVVFDRSGALISEFECPYVKVSRCCGLKITSEGYVVTLAKNNHHVLILNTLYIM